MSATWGDVRIDPSDYVLTAADAERMAREVLADALVGDVAGGLAVLCHDRAGAPAVPGLTDEHCWERARGIVQALIMNYRIEAL